MPSSRILIETHKARLVDAEALVTPRIIGHSLALLVPEFGIIVDARFDAGV